MRVYDAKDYKHYLRQTIAANKATRGYQARLAEAAGCQKTYLSQVIHTAVHLTPDHGIGLCNFWRLGPDETSFFLDLVHLERSATKELRSYLSARLDRARAGAATLTRELKKPALEGEGARLAYYGAWYLSAIHVLVSIPDEAGGWTAVRIATRLRLPEPLVKDSLTRLEEMGMVARSGSGWTSVQRDIHLPGESALTALNHFNWRHRALTRLQEGGSNGLHYTAVHTLSRDDITRVRDCIRQCIMDTRAIVAPSPEEELVAFTCDFFIV